MYCCPIKSGVTAPLGVTAPVSVGETVEGFNTGSISAIERPALMPEFPLGLLIAILNESNRMGFGAPPPPVAYA